MSEWISVKDRLPCEQEPVLIFDGTMYVDQLVDDEDEPGLQWEYNFDNPSITHWMPLPEPPEGEVMANETPCPTCGSVGDVTCEECRATAEKGTRMMMEERDEG